MSDATITGILTAIPPTLVALGTLVQGWRVNKKASALVGKTDTIITKAEEIHTLTNSNLTKVSADLAVALERITVLEAHIVRLAGTPPSAA